MTTYAGAAALAALVARRTGRVPDRYAVGDLVLGAIATHKFARIHRQGGGGHAVAGAVHPSSRARRAPAEGRRNAPRGGAPAHGVGELLLCPFCLGPWIGGAYVAGLALAPRGAPGLGSDLLDRRRLDFLQHAYARLRTD